MPGVFVGKNNSKKISELKPRDIITYHQSYSWIPIAQYDHRINSYVNLAINISSITGYSTSSANSYSAELIENERIRNEEMYHPEDWLDLYNVGYNTNEDMNSYYITNSNIAYNISSYTFSYSSYVFGWQYLFGNNDRPEIVHPKYKYNELEEYIYTEDGRKILLDD